MGSVVALVVVLLGCWVGSGEAVRDLGEKSVTKIAFGSCSDQDRPQPIWPAIVNEMPDLWVWMGDVTYNDQKLLPLIWTPATQKMIKEKYDKQKKKADYLELLRTCPVIGVWDDHDYGKNNGGGEYFNKVASQQLFLEFLDEPKDSPRWHREGIYESYVIGEPGRRVKVILLDVRYFKEDGEKPGADILGEAQWSWLEKELAYDRKDDGVQLRLVVSGIQVLPYDKPFQEKWGNYPASRERLFRAIRESRAPGVVLLSGDVHYAEFLQHNCTGIGYPLIEATSSGLSHSLADSHLGTTASRLFLSKLMKSSLRVGESFPRMNFGVVSIKWDNQNVGDTLVSIEIHDVKGKVRTQKDFRLSELRPGSAFENQHFQECLSGEHVSGWVNWSVDQWIRLIKFSATFLFLFLLLFIAGVPLLNTIAKRRKKDE